jgi:hypothetical protein
MSDHVNGGTPPQMVRSLIPAPPGGEHTVIYTLSNGQYIGEIKFRATSNDFLRAMSQDFLALIQQQTGGVAAVPADVLSQLEKLRRA